MIHIVRHLLNLVLNQAVVRSLVSAQAAPNLVAVLNLLYQAPAQVSLVAPNLAAVVLNQVVVLNLVLLNLALLNQAPAQAQVLQALIMNQVRAHHLRAVIAALQAHSPAALALHLLAIVLLTSLENLHLSTVPLRA